MVHGGQRFNIIPETVDIEGTVRTYDPEVRDLVEARMNEVLGGIASSGGGSYSLNYDRGTPATINDRELTAESILTVQQIVGGENTQELDPTMGGEDFSYFANEVPGFFYRLGIHREGTTTGPHHSPFFPRRQRLGSDRHARDVQPPDRLPPPQRLVGASGPRPRHGARLQSAGRRPASLRDSAAKPHISDPR